MIKMQLLVHFGGKDQDTTNDVLWVFNDVILTIFGQKV